MSPSKDDPSGWTTPQDGSAGPGEPYDPNLPETEDRPTGGPVSHGTPLRRKDYERLKEQAERDRSPSDADAQMDPSAC